MPFCVKCKKLYPFGLTYCKECGNKLVLGELKPKRVSEPSSSVIQKETIITEIEVIYCTHCGTKNNARLTNCTHCQAPIR